MIHHSYLILLRCSEAIVTFDNPPDRPSRAWLQASILYELREARECSQYSGTPFWKQVGITL